MQFLAIPGTVGVVLTTNCVLFLLVGAITTDWCIAGKKKQKTPVTLGGMILSPPAGPLI